MKSGTKSLELRVRSINSVTDSFKKLIEFHLSARHFAKYLEYMIIALDYRQEVRSFPLGL